MANVGTKERILTNVERWNKEHSPGGKQYTWQIIAETISMDVLEQTMEILNERQKNQTWLADQLGVNRSRVSYLFTAHPNMKLQTIGQIASVLKVKPRFLLDSERYEITHKLQLGTDIEESKGGWKAIIPTADATGTANTKTQFAGAS